MNSAQLFEGRPLPVGEALSEHLRGRIDLDWMVRAAVVDETYADRIADWIEAELAATGPAFDVALELARALGLRYLTSVVRRWVPLHAEHPCVVPAFEFALDHALPGDSSIHSMLVWGLDHGALRLQAWRALSKDAPELALGGLATLLSEQPEHAAECARRLAMVHTDHCQAACEAIRDLPESTRRAFAEPLQKHLMRIFAVKKWVTCRRILFGK